MVTGEQVKNAMIDAGITHVDHHKCAICDEMVGYKRIGDKLYFLSACGCCIGSLPEERSWERAADWINMQSNAACQQEIMARFGFDQI